MSDAEKLRHDLVNSVATLKMMARGVGPIVAQILDYCAAHQMKIVSAEHEAIVRQSFSMIEEEADKVLRYFDEK